MMRPRDDVQSTSLCAADSTAGRARQSTKRIHSRDDRDANTDCRPRTDRARRLMQKRCPTPLLRPAPPAKVRCYIEPMADLLAQVRDAVAAGRYVISNHADDRLRERRIPAWQVEAGVGDAELVQARPDATPNPVVEVEQILADGTPIKAVWSILPYNHAAKLVTVHFLDR